MLSSAAPPLLPDFESAGPLRRSGPVCTGPPTQRIATQQIMIGVGMGLLGWVAAAIHLFMLDPLYLRRGPVLQRVEESCRPNPGGGNALLRRDCGLVRRPSRVTLGWVVAGDVACP